MPNRIRSRFTLAQLRALEAVVRNAGFTRAAVELHLSQPTVSIQVKDLTDALGTPLVESVGRKVVPTESGAEVLASARRIFDEWAALEMRLAELKGLKRGRLRVAAVTTAEYFLPGLLGPFTAKHPGIDVELAVENRDRVVARLEAARDDLYVMMMPPDGDDLALAPFLANPLVPVAAQNHALAGRRRVPLDAFAAEPLLMRERGSGTRMAAEAFFAEKGVAPRTRMELGSNEAIKHAVAAGLGVAVLSRHTLARDPARDRLAVLDVRGFPLQRTWYFVYSAARRLPVVARAFLDFALAEAKRA
jgi:DNA-binding transcriptional LysR family regulator